MATKLLRNPHPGVILKEEFLDELNISQNALAKAIGNSYDLREAHRAIDQNIREIVPFRLTA